MIGLETFDEHAMRLEAAALLRPAVDGWMWILVAAFATIALGYGSGYALPKAAVRCLQC